MIMEVTLNPRTEFILFARQVDQQLSDMGNEFFQAEDGNLYRIVRYWKDDLGKELAPIEKVPRKRRRQLAEHIGGMVGAYIARRGDLNTITDMATMTLDIATQNAESISVTVYVRFDELPDFCPPAIVDRLSNWLRRIVTPWPETQAQIRDSIPRLQPFVSSQEWQNWRNFLGEADEWEQLGIRRPTNPRTLENWRRLYSVMAQLDDEYRYSEEVSPKWEDYIERIKAVTGKERSERHLLDVKKAGDAGLLR